MRTCGAHLTTIHFFFALARRSPSIKKKKKKTRYGIRGLVIDPYNELDHQRHSSMSETEYVSQMLTKIKRFAQHNDVHVWFVAHPKQLQQWKGDPPNLYDISGSAHFVNKADAGVVVHRVRNEDGPNDKVSTYTAEGWGVRQYRRRGESARAPLYVEGVGHDPVCARRPLSFPLTRESLSLPPALFPPRPRSKS